MPKRGADEYITKEHGSIANANSGEEKPAMSTAAQLARRKIATPKGRLNANRSSHNSSLGGGSTSTFGNGIPQQTFPGLNAGINFGSSTQNPSSDANGGFNFQPPQSSTFNFGVPTTTPNPFSSINGSSFSMNAGQDVSMESPQKKAAFGNAFGSNNMNSNTGPSFTFGQAAQQQPNGSFAFGANQSANNTAGSGGGGLFGRISKPEHSQPPSNPFGQPAQSQPSFGGFGQGASTPQSPASSFTFGQTNNNAAAPTSAPSFTFGQSTSVPQSPMPSFGGGQVTETQPSGEQPKFTFGQSSASSNLFGSGNMSGAQTPTAGFGAASAAPVSFGQSQTTSTPSSLFGGSGGAAKSDESKSAPPLFGTSTNTSQPDASNQEQSASPEKSTTSSSEPAAQASANPFASLFAGAGTPPIAPVSKPSFSFGAPSQPSGSPSANKATEPSSSSKSSFSFGASAQPSSTSGSADTEKPSATPKPAFSFGTSQMPPAAQSTEAEGTSVSKGSFTFGATGAPPAGPASTAESKSSEPKSSSVFSFGSKQGASETSNGSDKSKEAASPVTKPTFGFSATSTPVSSGGLFSPAKNNSTGESGGAGKLFGKPANATDAGKEPVQREESTPGHSENPAQGTASSLFSATPKSAADVGNRSSGAELSSSSSRPSLKNDMPPSTSEPSKTPVYTKAPPFIPSHLDAERYREYDRNYRLHSLNAGLQQKLATLDPRSYDFDNIIRHYVAARDSIGASLGLYTRNLAGTKRKGDRIDADDERPPSNKRTRSDNGPQTTTTQSKSSSIFGTGFTPQQPNSDQTPNDSNSSRATARLNEIIPEKGPSSIVGRPEPAPQDNNPFSQITSGPQPSTAAPSTTPTKSPPKKPVFEVPKFGAGGTNFMSAFGAKAKENAEKFEKNLIEKRKAEDFDSDEDDEETFRKQTEEEMRAKRAKFESVAKGGFTPKIASGSASASASASEKSSTSASTPSASVSAGTATPKPANKFGISGPVVAQKPAFSSPGFSGLPAMAPFHNPFAALSSTGPRGEQPQNQKDANPFAALSSTGTSGEQSQNEKDKDSYRNRSGGFSKDESDSQDSDRNQPGDFSKDESDREDRYRNQSGGLSKDEGDSQDSDRNQPGDFSKDESDREDRNRNQSGGFSKDDTEREDDDGEGESSGYTKDEADQDEEDKSESSDDAAEEYPHGYQANQASSDDKDGEEDDDNDFQKALDRSAGRTNAGKSLFDRIEPNPDRQASNEGGSGTGSTPPIFQSAKNSSFPPAVWGSHIGKSTPEAPTFSPITPATGAAKSGYKPASTFNFTPTPVTTTAAQTPGASIFAGGVTKGGPVPGEGLFGSRPSTPSNADKNNNLAKSILTSPAGTDNTWKEGAPISFGSGNNSSNGPTFKFTSASPRDNDSSTPKPFGSLFGTPSTTAKNTETSNQVGFQFGVPNSSTPAPGFLGAISHLGGGSAGSSAVSSRATSPGVTDNESVATNETDETPEDPQASLMESRAGEENESCLWEGRSKAVMFVTKEMAQGTKLNPNDWNSMGVGQIRLLKHKETGKTRIVFRVEPNANILINSHLVDGVAYENASTSKSGAVKGPLFYKGNLVRWVLKVKTPDMASELAKLMEDNKSASA
ncbi:hypothetical protein ABEF93_007064 [Exophiala dermatitidis]